MGRRLEMQPAQNASALGMRQVVLHETHFDAQTRQGPLIVGLDEPAPAVRVPSRANQLYRTHEISHPRTD
jgi:hypothetical protein